jgi:hypothetical protein
MINVKEDSSLMTIKRMKAGDDKEHEDNGLVMIHERMVAVW